ncbi:MAG: polysaccharide deacetylase, partial [Oscillospiraceae bacterium]|nr:polysaccharide deacetylase [Oscillospiraceae bacterium]
VTRTVVVHQATNPTTVEPGEKTIYLTFDDGPGPYTGMLLDILSAYNVPATFFVTCLNDKYEDYIGRAYREGHAIGVHTASHNYYDIYSSEDAFFNDFNAVQDMIYSQNGEYTELTRFPGGSSNTVSSFNPGIMSRLAYSLESMGYKYFDWNVTSGDAGETTDTDTVAANIINGIAGRKYAVVLQHDIKDYSVNAVEEVILWGLNNGYAFRALNSSSPTAHHGIAN